MPRPGPYVRGPYWKRPFPPRPQTYPPQNSIPGSYDGTVSPNLQGTAVTTVWPAYPMTGGDLVLLMVSFGSGASPTTITQAGGATMTLLDNIGGTSIETAIYWRFFITGDVAPSFTLSTSRSWSSHTTAFRGVDQTNPFGPGNIDHAQQAQASSTTYTTPTLTPSENNSMVVATLGGKVAASTRETITPAPGWTSTGPLNQSDALTTDCWCGAFHYLPLASPAATSEVATVGVAGIGVTGILALNPAGGAVITPLVPQVISQYQGIF